MQDTTSTQQQEETIDIRELFAILKQRKKLILIVTAFFILLALAYVFTAKPIYEAKAVVELAQINKKPVHPAETLKQKIKTIFINDENDETIKYPILSNISIPKKTSNILILKTQGYSNDSATKKLQEVIGYINSQQSTILKNYEQNQKKHIAMIEHDLDQNRKLSKKIREDIVHYEKKLLHISKQDAALAGIYAIELGKKQTEYNNLLFKISYLENKKAEIDFTLGPNNIQKTTLVGKIRTFDKPIKPKKTLVLILALISGLMLSIFLAFFVEFLQDPKKEK